MNLNHHDRDIEDPWLRARLAMLAPGARILDVGCVDGWVLDEYPSATGADSREFPGGAHADRLRVGDAEHLGDDLGPFDAVTCVSVLEHVGLGWYGDAEGDAEKPGRVIAEMARVLHPDGWLLLTVPIGLLMTKHGRPFAREIDESDLCRWLTAAGLRIYEWLTVVAPTWHAAKDDRGETRVVALVTAVKV